MSNAGTVCVRLGVIAAGKPVAVNVVALLVPWSVPVLSATKFPIRYHVAVLVVAEEKPVPVNVNVPRSGVISTSDPDVGPRAARATGPVENRITITPASVIWPVPVAP
jgi:hypothetical protein